MLSDLERENPRFIFFTRNIFSNPYSADMPAFEDSLISYLSLYYDQLAVVDRNENGKAHLVNRPEAIGYVPKGGNFMILFERTPDF